MSCKPWRPFFLAQVHSYAVNQWKGEAVRFLLFLQTKVLHRACELL
jgi:hypothetical protein